MSFSALRDANFVISDMVSTYALPADYGGVETQSTSLGVFSGIADGV